MGISNLLPILRSIIKKMHVKNLAGLRAAIDSYGWLHRGTYSCATEICIQGDSEKYVRYCISRAEMLIANKITPVFVFDGGLLPIKGNKEAERRQKRQNALKEGLVLHRNGNSKGAHQAFTKAVDVTPEMAHKLIQVLKQRNIEYVVAPYEADAQLAYLIQQRICDFVISEDSDCIAFGCQKVLFKLDSAGNGEYLDMALMKNNCDLDLSAFTNDMILDMCILAGCDYLASVPGMGIKRAYQLVRRYKVTAKILKGLKFDGSFEVPRNYESNFIRARLAFRHQRIFTALANNSNLQIKPLNDIPENLNIHEMDYVGPSLDKKLASEIANGNFNPITKQRIEIRSKKSAETATTDKRKTVVEQTIKEISTEGTGNFIRMKRKRPTSRELRDSLVTPYLKSTKATGSDFKAPRVSLDRDDIENQADLQNSLITSRHFTDCRSVDVHEGYAHSSSKQTVEISELDKRVDNTDDHSISLGTSNLKLPESVNIRDTYDAEIYHSDLVSPAFRPLPIANISTIKRLQKEIVHADVEKTETEEHKSKNSVEPSETKRNEYFELEKGSTKRDTISLFKLYKFKSTEKSNRFQTYAYNNSSDTRSLFYRNSEDSN